MRVLQAMAGAAQGGAEAFFMRLVLALHRAGLDQRVVIRRNGERAAILVANGLTPTELRFGGMLDLTTGPGLRRAIAAYRPHIVLSWMSRAARFVPAGDHVNVARLGGYYDLKYYGKCQHLVVNTRDIRRYVIDRGWPADRAHCLPNFVDAAPAPPVDRSSHDTPADAPLLLALGRLHPNKGFDVLLDALAEVGDAYLWLAGDGPLTAELRSRADRLGVAPRVRFLGWQDDTAGLLAAADAVICASRHEPLGNVVIEAWAHGVPVIAAASQGPGALIRDGENGLLVPVDHAGDLARAVRRLIDDGGLRDRLAANGRVCYETDFTEPKVVGRYMEFFERLAG